MTEELEHSVLVRVGLLVLALVGVNVGAWATFAPRSFYDDFPGGGRHWIAPDGPFNEHLIRDVGALNLALVVVTVAALVTLRRSMVLTTAIAWLVYSVPHVVYHSRHSDAMSGQAPAAAIGGIFLTIVVAVMLIVVCWRQPEGA